MMPLVVLPPAMRAGVVPLRGEMTKLHVAAAGGDAKTITRAARRELWLVNSTDAEGLTPLHYAARQGKLPAVQALVALGAHIDAPG